VTPREMVAADQKIEFIAEKAVTKMRAPQGASQVDKESKRCKNAGKGQSCAKRHSVAIPRLISRQNGCFFDCRQLVAPLSVFYGYFAGES
ncbi:MAG: hypothetical protein WCC73_01800, partial [Terracidiphilus sp.]